MPTAKGEFKIQQWDEAPYSEGEGGRKLTRATVTQSFTGDLEGTGTTEYLMVYRPDKTAEYTGVQRIDGTLGGKRGVFVVTLVGAYDGTVARADTTIVAGAGGGALDGMTGKGTFAAPHGSVGTYTFQYELPAEH